jgi:Ca-activated chloride channel homolog
MIARWLLSGLLAILIHPVAAQEATDANLITAIDVSGSIEPADERLELEGMAQAVADPMFLQAIKRGRQRRIGFVVFTWANGEFIPLVPWTLIASQAEAEQVAERLRAARGMPMLGYVMPDAGEVRPWRRGHATDVSGAMDYAIGVSDAAPFASHHHVINICANGIDNVGRGPAPVRDRALEQGLIINGLVLGLREDSEQIADYFREHVQAGFGSFVIEARAFEDITKAMLAKFMVELAALEPRLRVRQGLS